MSNLDIVTLSYNDLLKPQKSISALQRTEHALLNHGIIGISEVPNFEKTSRVFIQTAREFSALSEKIKQQYTPARDIHHTEGYELGAEKFQDAAGNWQIDDKKASYYAFVPDHARNKWPAEVNLRDAYLALGEMMFTVGKLLFRAIKLDESVGLSHDHLAGYGRMLHYHKEGCATNYNTNWCGAHYDHGIFTGLMPAYYFQQEHEVAEPEEAGLFVMPTKSNSWQKISAHDKSILFFQVGEFSQLLSHDKIRATQHHVKKAHAGIERYTFALFFSGSADTQVTSRSILTTDARYVHNRSASGGVTYEQWEKASYERYRA